MTFGEIEHRGGVSGLQRLIERVPEITQQRRRRWSEAWIRDEQNLSKISPRQQQQHRDMAEQWERREKKEKKQHIALLVALSESANHTLAFLATAQQPRVT